MRLLVLLTLAIALVAAAAVPAGAGPTRAGDTEPLDVILNLGGRREAALERYVRAVSDPASPRYRRYLSLRRLAERFGAPPRESDRVVSFLRARGASARVDPTGTFVHARVSASLASSLFSSPPARAGGHGVDRPLAKPVVPAPLRALVDGVGGLDAAAVVSHATPTPSATFGPAASGRQRTGTPGGCPDGQSARSPLGIPGFTPNQWLTAYGVDRLHARGVTGAGQRLGLIGIDGYLESDLHAAAACFGYTAPPLRRVLAGIDEPLAPGGETTLDLQVIAATAPGLEEIQVYQGDGSAAGLLLTFLAPLEQPPDRRPHVVSASLGACEPAYANEVSLLEAGEQLYRAYAALGITLVASAGDTGSSGCALDGNSSALAVPAASYPASSAHVTAVGGTNVELDGANAIVEEVVWNDNPITLPDGSRAFGGAGGGGQSLVVDRPWWQRGRTVVGPKRLVPDVAQLADVAPGYSIYCTAPGEELCQPGGFVSVGGTSAAAPLFAAGVALANEAAARHGQPRLGFVNPLLYAVGNRANAVFNDVVHGSNDIGPFLPAAAGGGGSLGCCHAGAGWDRASGWGSVDAAALAAAARAAFAARPRP